MMYDNLVVYCDMDGVLADFDGQDNAVERFRTEKNFFFNLAPIEKNTTGLEILYMGGAKIYILTATPHKRADNDKRKWIKKYLPFIPKENVICMRIGQDKSDFIKEEGILFDDYGKNIAQWAAKGMKAYKIGEKSIMTYLAEME